MDLADEFNLLEGKITAHASILVRILERLDMTEIPAELSEQADRVEAAQMDDTAITLPLHHYRAELAAIAARLAQRASRRRGGGTTR